MLGFALATLGGGGGGIPENPGGPQCDGLPAKVAPGSWVRYVMRLSGGCRKQPCQTRVFSNTREITGWLETAGYLGLGPMPMPVPVLATWSLCFLRGKRFCLACWVQYIEHETLRLASSTPFLFPFPALQRHTCTCSCTCTLLFFLYTHWPVVPAVVAIISQTRLPHIYIYSRYSSYAGYSIYSS